MSDFPTIPISTHDTPLEYLRPLEKRGEKVVVGFLAAQMWPAGVTKTCGFLTRKAMCLPPLQFFREQVSLKKKSHR